MANYHAEAMGRQEKEVLVVSDDWFTFGAGCLVVGFMLGMLAATGLLYLLAKI